MNEVKQYAERDLMEMDRAGNHYCRHVDHMTREKLHSKSDIAAELGWRDMQIANLKEQLTATTNSLTNAQEALKSAGIEADTVQAGVMELVSRVDGISHECGMMMGLLNDVYRYHEECTHDDMMHALIPLEYVSAINGFVERDVDGENPCPITDAYLNAVRAEVLENVPTVCDGKEQLAFEAYASSKGLDLSKHPLHYLFLDGKTNQARSAWRECLVYVAAQLRAGNAGKDGSHE